MSFSNKLLGFEAMRAQFHLYIKKATRHVQRLNSCENNELLEWSSWVDFNTTTIDDVPESEGVYKLHASMKILFIGSSKNLRQSLKQDLTNPCINNNSRFSYTIVKAADRIKEDLLIEYQNKHDGKLPLCM
jgi:hypothetical protein